MSYVELYSDDILDTVNIGKSNVNFNPSSGDYIKVQIYKENSDAIKATLYSNRLLLKYPEIDNYYIGDYHFHPENPTMGFCGGKVHTKKSKQNLQPILSGGSLNEPLNPESKYKKQIDIFKDDRNNIYIKPNEIIKLLKLGKGKYKLRIYFLRNIKSSLANFLSSNNNNLIENGNFLAGLEATQTGDIDRSVGRNHFNMMDNPGKGKFVLEQDGLEGNKYDMRITGVDPNSEYILSYAFALKNYNGSGATNARVYNNSMGGNFVGIKGSKFTDYNGSWLDLENPDDKQASRFIYFDKKINGMGWFKKWYRVDTTGITDGMVRIVLGQQSGMGQGSTNVSGRVYFTDLRFEKVEPGTENQYLEKLKSESK